MQNKVEIIITSDSKGAITGIAQAGESIKSLRSQVTGLQASLGDVAKGLGLFYGIKETIEGVTSAVRESLRFLGQMETSALGIAAAYMVGGKYIDQTTGKALAGEAALRAAQGESKQMLEELQVANMQTIATLDQLVRAYQETLPVAMSKGFDKKMAKDFTVAMVQAAGAIGLPLEQMGEETRSILTGNINPRTSRIATVLGLRNEDIKNVEGNAQKLFDFLMERLDAYKVAGIESQKTWAGLWSNTKDIALQIGGKVFEPLFEAIKEGLSEITNKIVAIDEKTRTIKWNDEFLSTINMIREAISIAIDDVTRLAMLLDKAGGTMTAIMHYGTLAEYKLSLGTWTEAGKSAEKWKERNKMYEERYKENERSLYTRQVTRQGVLKPASPEKLEALQWTTPAGAGLVEMTTKHGQKLYFEQNEKSQKAGYKANPPRPSKDKTDEARAGVEAGLREKLALLREEEAQKLEFLKTDEKRRELSHKKGILSEKEYISETNALKREALEWGIAYAQKEKEAISLAWDQKKGLYNEEKDRIKEEGRVKVELTKRDTEIAKKKEELTRLGIDNTIEEIEYSKRLSEARRDGELKTLEAELSLKKKLIEIGLERGEMTQLQAKQKELDLEEHIQKVRIENLRLKYREAEKDAEKISILAEIAAQEQEILAIAAQRARTEQEMYGSLEEGLSEGLKKYTSETRTSFQQGVEIARQTAQGMDQAFSDLFFDSFQGKLGSLWDHVKAFLTSVQRALANSLGQQSTSFITKAVSSLFSSGGNTGTASGDVDSGYFDTKHDGGIVRKFIPTFHGGGLNDNERLVINKVGERYITEEQNSWLNRVARVAEGGQPNVVVNIDNKTGIPFNARELAPKTDKRQQIRTIMLELAGTDPAVRNAFGVRGA